MMRALLCLCLVVTGLVACSLPDEPLPVHRLEDYPAMGEWLEHARLSARDESTRFTAARLGELLEALSNLDHDYLSEWAAEDLVQHNPMLEGGREGLLRLTKGDGIPRGGAPNLLAGVSHLLIEGELALIHRVGKLGPLQSANFELLRIDSEGRFKEHWGFQQPIEAGLLDNVMFSFVVPRQLDLIPLAADTTGNFPGSGSYYQDKLLVSGTESEANLQLVLDYLRSVAAGDDPSVLTQRFLADDYWLHLPGVKPGRKHMQMILQRAQRREQPPAYEITLAQNDLVWVLTRVPEIRNQDIPELASADLFRVRENKIVEQWKVVQPRPRFSRNKHELF